MNLHLLTRGNSTWSLNPELVVPCRSITLSVGHLAMNYEYVAAINLFDVAGERVPGNIAFSIGFPQISTLFLTPSANLEVVLHIVVCNVGIFPWGLCITIREQFFPLNGT